MITLSLNSIKESIYALTALHCYLSPSEYSLPQILSRDHSEALTALIRRAAIDVTLQLHDLRAEVIENSGDTVAVSLSTAGNITVLRHGIESAVEALVLKTCFARHDGKVAAQFAADYERRMEALKERSGADTVVPRLRPNPY